MMSSDDAHLPETFASIRFAGIDLQPESISRLLGLKPTIAFAKGDQFKAGARQLPQLRRFGLWLFSTEPLVASRCLADHERVLLLGLTARHSRARLKRFAEDAALQTTVSLYWYGPAGAHIPAVSTRLMRFVDALGATIETEFEIETADEQVA